MIIDDTPQQQLPCIMISLISNFDFDKLEETKRLLSDCIDPERLNLIDEIPTIIRAGVNQQLDSFRKLYSNLNELLKLHAESALRKLHQAFPSHELFTFTLNFFPQLGYFVSVEKSEENMELLSQLEIEDNSNNNNNYEQNQGCNSQQNEQFEYEENGSNDEEDEQPRQLNASQNRKQILSDWVYQFELNGNVFFKNDFVGKLDQEYGDIHGKITDLELTLLRQIENLMLNDINYFSQLNELLAFLDCFFVLACAAKKFNLTRPIISPYPMLLIKDARHPLVEIFGKNQFIPNDYFTYNYIDDFDNDFTSPMDCLINKNYSNKCSILTGANYSGKSIFLKSIGIIVLLAQIGSFVPASACKLGLFDKILTSMQHFDSVAPGGGNGVATRELANMARILKMATNRSLILVDEFPKNLNFTEGVTIFGSLINQLKSDSFQQNNNLPNQDLSNLDSSKYSFQDKATYEKIPTSIVITHFKDIILENQIQENYLIRILTMECMLNKQSQQNYNGALEILNQEIVYLYKMKPGFTETNYSILLAKKILGNNTIVERIAKIQNTLNQGIISLEPVDEIKKACLENVQTVVSWLKQLNY